MALRDRRCATGPLGGTAHRTTRPPPPSPRDPRLPSPRGRRSPDPPLASSSTRNRVHPDGKPGKRKDTRMKRTGFRLFRFDRSCVTIGLRLFFGRLTVDSTIAGGTTQIAGISRIHTIFGGVGTLSGGGGHISTQAFRFAWSASIARAFNKQTQERAASLTRHHAHLIVHVSSVRARSGLRPQARNDFSAFQLAELDAGWWGCVPRGASVLV